MIKIGFYVGKIFVDNWRFWVMVTYQLARVFNGNERGERNPVNFSFLKFRVLKITCFSIKNLSGFDLLVPKNGIALIKEIKDFSVSLLALF